MEEGPGQSRLIDRFRQARRDDGWAVLEGFHALKHALRFEGAVEAVLTSEPAELERLAAELAPDVGARLRELATAVPEELYRELGPYAHHTRVAGLARRPRFEAAAVLRERRDAPVVLLEDPRHLGNLGAVVRVAAAADAAGVLTTGDQDPWDPVAIRGSGGLHFALPVGRIAALDGADRAGRPLLAIDPEGEQIDPRTLPADAIYAFGSERNGLSDAAIAAADRHLRIPMRPGVSSLNLATSVSAVLFAWRLTGGDGVGAAGTALGEDETGHQQ
ncbi:MAG TPA: TrmH family RNA methyltransferase [Thermoleophilaceae bacterium]|nr:TrmH family RNA methyltransferase [Thermoleophilaceae bacterium]